MALPLANPLYNVQPGGPIVTSLLGRNALEKSNLENQFYPINSMAQAASQLAYSNLMGPQFLAKLATNPDFLANVDKKTQEKVMPYLYNAAMSQGAGNSILNMPHQSPSGLGGFLVDKLMNVFGKKEMPQQMNQQNMPQQVPVQVGGGQQMVSPQVANAFQNMQPGDAIQIPENQNAMINPVPSQKSVPEKTGEFLGIKEEGRKAGEIRAKDIKDLSDTYSAAVNQEDTLNELVNILASPEFEKIKQVPLAGRHELGYYAKFGTPEQQEMIGRFFTLTGNIIKNSARDFPGAFRIGEQGLLSSMKPNPSDTVDVAKGKLESLMMMNQMLMRRSRIASQLMKTNHINKDEAMELADKQINGNEIRNNIKKQLNPRPTDADIKYMMQKYNISEAEVKKRLKEKGINYA